MLKPFVLRRLKKDHLSDQLQDKVEKLVPVGLTAVQRQYYAAVLTSNFKILNGRDKQNRKVRAMQCHVWCAPACCLAARHPPWP